MVARVHPPRADAARAAPALEHGGPGARLSLPATLHDAADVDAQCWVGLVPDDGARSHRTRLATTLDPLIGNVRSLFHVLGAHIDGRAARHRLSVLSILGWRRQRAIKTFAHLPNRLVAHQGPPKLQAPSLVNAHLPILTLGLRLIWACFMVDVVYMLGHLTACRVKPPLSPPTSERNDQHRERSDQDSWS